MFNKAPIAPIAPIGIQNLKDLKEPVHFWCLVREACDPKGIMAFLQNQFRCPPMLGLEEPKGPKEASPFGTTMGLVKADLGSWCACETVPTLIELTYPTLGSSFSRSPRAICTVGLILEILCCNPQGLKALLRVPSTEGRGVRLWWAHS